GLHLGGVVAGRGLEVGHGVASVDPTRSDRLFPMIVLISYVCDDTWTTSPRRPPVCGPQSAGAGRSDGHNAVGGRRPRVRPIEPSGGDDRARAARVRSGADVDRAATEVEHRQDAGCRPPADTAQRTVEGVRAELCRGSQAGTRRSPEPWRAGL